MKISASLYSSIQRPLAPLVRQLDRCHIDYLHLDCIDNPEVFDDIGKIREISSTPIDLHVISSTPEKYFEMILEHEIELVTFQYENLSKPLELPKKGSTSWGLAVVSETPVEVFESYRDSCDFILMMTTSPGHSGGKFHKDTFRRIREFRKLYPGKAIHVDGGVNDETGFILRILGVNTVVSGSYLVNHASIGEALLHLRSSVVHSDYRVRDFMIALENIPLLKRGFFDVADVIKKIDECQLGFALIADEDDKLFGLSSNADVRKGLLKNLENFNNISLQDIINENPVSIDEQASISDLLSLIRSKDFLISYLPVTGKNRKLTGALSFINLIRSES